RSIPNMYMNFFCFVKTEKKLASKTNLPPVSTTPHHCKAGANIERFFIRNKMFPKKNSIKNQPIEFQFVTTQKRLKKFPAKE
ncbi:MAG: hypothetical protein ED555_13865, partial [Allomuricauda sp.]